MAKKTINLTGITAGSFIQVDGNTIYTLIDADVRANKATAAGYGTFDFSTASTTKFVADAALAGEISLSATDATITAADFSKATAGVKIATTADMLTVTSGAGNDTIVSAQTGGVINAGAGNDIVSITAGTDNVTLGAGADTLEMAGGKATVADYNYYEGDVIKSADAVALAADGKLDIGSGNIVSGDNGVAVQDNWYAAKVDNAGTVVDYFTAVKNNNQTVSKDLSNSVITNYVDASGAKNANITLGHGTDNVTLTSGVDTVKVGKSAGNNITDIASDDVIAIDGVKLSDISLTASANEVAVNYAASTVKTGVATTGGSLNFNDGSKTHKLAFDKLDAGTTIDYATAADADWVIGATDNGTILEVGDTTHLHETDKYKNITKIKVATGLKLNAPISLTGATGKANTIDASAADVGNAVAVWGYSSKNDTIKLRTDGKAQDNIWFGANDGNDIVTGFTYGTASDSDVLYLKDTKTLNDINVSVNGGNALFTVSKNDVLTMNTVAAAGAGANNVVQIKLADEKLYRVAGNVGAADAVTIDTDTTGDLNFYAFDKSKKQTVALKGSKDWVVHSLYTDFYTTNATIGTIDATNATGNVTLAAAATIKGGKGTSNIWTYQSDAAASVEAGDGTDIIWFAENADQAVSVSNFTADTDVVKFATAQSLKEIADNYSFATVTGADAKITGVNNADSNMTITKAGTTFGAFTITDANDKAYKALVSAGTATFSADVNIYAGMTALNASKDFEGTVSVRVGKESRGLSSDTYFIDDSVTTFDASKSTATFWIAGNQNAATIIRGGQNENYLYGGGAASDELVGSIVAKDTFYFGTGDGTDAISGGVDKEDTIALWNVEDADIANVSVSINKANKVEISLSDSSKLTITDTNGATALTDGLTFTSASQTAYTYDSESKTLVKKA